MPPAAPVRLVWEYKQNQEDLHWRRLNTLSDTSVAFTREGYITLQGPVEIAATQEGKVEEACYWLRCRLMEGTYRGDQIPVIDFIRPNTVSAKNLTTIVDEIVGTSEGMPNQYFTLENRPIFPNTLKLSTEVEGELPEK